MGHWLSACSSASVDDGWWSLPAIPAIDLSTVAMRRRAHMSIPSSRCRPVRGRVLSNPRRPAVTGFRGPERVGRRLPSIAHWRASVGCAEDGKGMDSGITYLFDRRVQVDTSDASVAPLGVKRVRFMPSAPAVWGQADGSAPVSGTR